MYSVAKTCKNKILEACIKLRTFTVSDLQGCISDVSRAQNMGKTISCYLTRFVADGVLRRISHGHYELKMSPSEISKYMSQGGGSKGEKAICQFLDMWHIVYEREKTFDDLKDVSHLRYDFYIEKNGKKYLIEYHGRQHFESVEYFGGISSFHSRCINDLRKEIYAEENDFVYMYISDPTMISLKIKNILGMKNKRKYDEI